MLGTLVCADVAFDQVFFRFSAHVTALSTFNFLVSWSLAPRRGAHLDRGIMVWVDVFVLEPILGCVSLLVPATLKVSPVSHLFEETLEAFFWVSGWI